MELKRERGGYERACLQRLRKVMPAGVEVTVVADRGFGDHKVYQFLDELGFGYVIRFRDAQGERRLASEWVPNNGRARWLPWAHVTEQGHRVPAVVCVKEKGMKEAWCLVVSRSRSESGRGDQPLRQEMGDRGPPFVTSRTISSVWAWRT